MENFLVWKINTAWCFPLSILLSNNLHLLWKNILEVSVDSYGTGPVSSRFPEVTGPAPGWSRGIRGKIWNGCDQKFLEINSCHFGYYLDRCPGMVIHNIAKELFSPIRNSFIESKGMILVTATSKNEAKSRKS